MKTKLFLLLAASSLISCNTVKSGTAKSRDILGVGVIHKPVIADLDVNQQKTSKTIKLKSVESLDAAKNEAIRELLKENNADLFIEPKYETVTTNGRTELTITGWLAFYKNFRTIEEKDIKLLEVNPTISKNTEESQSILLTKKKK
jgi:hypothetical protein